MDSTVYDSTILSNEWNRRLKNAKQSAERGKEGDVSFLQVSTTPLTSLFITTGSIINDSISQKRNVHLKFVSQHSSYPPTIDTMEESIDKGYTSFKNTLEATPILNQERTFTEVNKRQYKVLFQKACSHIDMSIREYHGVKCYRDGDSTNNVLNNIFFLHICDILNILVCKKLDVTPEVIIKTSLLNTLSSSNIVNELESIYIDKEMHDFIVINADHLYLCYGYYSNHSFLAIRTSTKETKSIFNISSFFMTDVHFLNHQKGKLMELNQNEKRVQTRVVYRSI